MKKKFYLALAAMVLCGSFASCDKDDDGIISSKEDKEVDYYDYSEHGFFMNGDIKICGYFDNDSIMEGYTKYVKRTAHYRTVDGEEGECVFGWSSARECRSIDVPSERAFYLATSRTLGEE